MKLTYKFSKILKDLREQNGFTQKYVASKIGISYQSYQAYELGISVPTLENYIKIADLFDVPMDELVGRK